MEEANWNRELTRRLIGDRGLKIKWVAEEVGVTASHFSDALAGRRKVSRSVIKLLARLFNIDEQDLSGAEPN